MLFNDSFFTIENKAEGVFRDRGSKFIGLAFPVTTENEIKNILSELKKEHPSANHFCYAYLLGADKQNFRANDDGEPSGSAGKPILGQLQSKDLTNVLLVVVRYFGGTLLGVLGLINAYKQASIEALQFAQIIEKHIQYNYHTFFSFERMNDVMRLLKENEAKIINQEFTETCKIEFQIKKKDAEKLEKQFAKFFDVKLKSLNTN